MNDANTLPDNLVSVDFASHRAKRDAQRASQSEATAVSQPSFPKDGIASHKQAFATLLSEGIATLVLDSRAAEVRVPPEFMGQAELRLNFAYDFHVPDFAFDEVGAWATLSYNSGNFFTKIPWAAVYAMYGESGNGFLWPSHLPQDISFTTDPLKDE
jgi:hypothetical protein